MLQGISKLSGLVQLLGFLFMTCLACKQDTTSSLDEKTVYLEDYVSPEHTWGFIDTIGQLVIPAEYDEVAQFSEHLAAVNRSGFWGYIDREGNEIIGPQFSSAYTFHEGLARVKPFNKSTCYITSKGKLVASEEWAAAGDFSNGRALVRVGTQFGYIDTSGQWLIKPLYSKARNFENGLAIVEFQEKQGVIDLTGEYVIRPNYEQIQLTKSSELITGHAVNYSLIWDERGTVLDSIPNFKVNETDGKLVSISRNGKYQFYNLTTKKVVSKNLYTHPFYLGEHRWCAMQDSLFYLLDENGKQLGNTGYNQVNKFSNHIAAYKRGEYWGYLDINGKELTEPIFGLVWDYKNGFARAAFEDGIGFINSKQQLAFYPPEGSLEMRDFSEGLAPVQISRE